MRFFEFTKTKLTLLASIGIISFAGSTYFQQSALNKKSSLMAINSGMETCFQRVSQTFIALMTLDTKSSFLTKDFSSLTSECLSEVNNQYSKLSLTDAKVVSSNLNGIISDYHWFQTKVDKLVDFVKAGSTSLVNSNIIKKFSDLDELKSSTSEMISEQVNNQQFQAKTYQRAMFGATLYSVFLFALFGLSVRRKSRKSRLIEKEAGAILNLNDPVSTKVDVFLRKTLLEQGFENTFKLVQKYHSQLLEASMGDKAYVENVPAVKKNAKKYASINLHDCVDINLKELQRKFQSFGVKLHTELDDDLFISAKQDGVLGLIKHTLNYAVDRSKHSVLNLKTRRLGEAVLFNISIKNYCFNANELEYINSSSTQNNISNADLIAMVEESQNYPCTISMRNKINAETRSASAELEILFRASKVESAQKEIKVIKGKKKDILRQMDM